MGQADAAVMSVAAQLVLQLLCAVVLPDLQQLRMSHCQVTVQLLSQILTRSFIVATEQSNSKP